MNNLESSQLYKETELELLNRVATSLGLPEGISSKDIYLKFFEEDQKIMNSRGEVDYLNATNQVQKIKFLLNEYEKNKDVESMNEDLKHILWLYYHHASQFEYSKKNKEKAIEYIEKALKFKDKNVNQITGLLALLFKDKILEAEEYIENMTSDEIDTAYSLLKRFKENYA